MLCQLAMPAEIKTTDVNHLEKYILEVIDFDVQFPSTYRFYELFCNLVKSSSLHRTFGQFILEIALLEINMVVHYKTSLLAFSTLFLVSQRIQKTHPESRQNAIIYQEVLSLLRQQTIYPREQLEKVAMELENSERHCMVSQVFSETRRKYQSERSMAVIVPYVSTEEAKYVYHTRPSEIG